jgi:hypothetical protein
MPVTTEDAIHFMWLPRTRWEEEIEHTPDDRRGELFKLLVDIAATASAAAAYVDSRYNGGCADVGHAKAVDVSNRAMRRARDIHGFYTTPPISF